MVPRLPAGALAAAGCGGSGAGSVLTGAASARRDSGCGAGRRDAVARAGCVRAGSMATVSAGATRATGGAGVAAGAGLIRPSDSVTPGVVEAGVAAGCRRRLGRHRGLSGRAAMKPPALLRPGTDGQRGKTSLLIPMSKFLRFTQPQQGAPRPTARNGDLPRVSGRIRDQGVLQRKECHLAGAPSGAAAWASFTWASVTLAT
jgi:hypothetical protein